MSIQTLKKVYFQWILEGKILTTNVWSAKLSKLSAQLSMQFQLFAKLPAQLLTKLPMLLVPTQEYDESS